MQLKNHYKPWDEIDLKRIALLAKVLESFQSMRALSTEIADVFEYTKAIVCKKQKILMAGTGQFNK